MNVPVNYRDVGAALKEFGVTTIKEGVLLRGGKLDFVTDVEAIGGARTIVNLRVEEDAPVFGDHARYVHVPASNSDDNYVTSSRSVRTWLRQVFTALADRRAQLPLYVHCRSGRDRTGIVVALVLVLCGVPRAAVLDEYLLSAGSASHLADIHAALLPYAEGRPVFDRLFKKIDLDFLVERLTTG